VSLPTSSVQASPPTDWLKKRSTIAILLGTLTVLLLTVTAPDIGLTWDEPAYIAASESYLGWFRQLVRRPAFALSARGIDRYWTANHEHPPLDKVWSGLVWSIARFALDDLTAHRLGNILLVGALVGMLYTMVATSAGTVAGLAAVAALLSMPRFFFHAHLAALDVPAAVAVFTVTFVFWRSRDRPRRNCSGRDRPAPWWGAILGLSWGMALATKVNALFVPPVLGLWTLIFRRRLVLFGRLLLMGLIGPPLSLSLWPWLYPDPWTRLDGYIKWVTVDHWKIGQWYLGRFYMPPPWHFAFVITLAVVPTALTVLCLLGIARAGWDTPRRALVGLLLLSALVPMLALAIGQSMVYDNDRLFMPSFPFLAALAGLGFAWLADGLRHALGRIAKPQVARHLARAIVALLFVPHLVRAGGIYPHLLSYYSEAIGGLPGAVRLGLETTYWCETYARALDYLNANAPPGAVVWVQDWSHDVMFYYQLQGQLRSDLHITWPETGWSVFGRRQAEGIAVPMDQADIVVLQYRETGFTDEIRRHLHGRVPVYRLACRGIPLLDIYER
jgi:4-amino-4-deoxy-L-arabinose transferase-like glycosyltransferase